MAGPFPGMDPYVEWQAAWPDFHNRLIAEICNELGVTLPDPYIARLEERIEVVTADADPPRSFRPDVSVGRFEAEASRRETVTALASTDLLEPTLVELLDRDPDEIRTTWVEIRVLPELELVTVIEVLTPVNKSWQGRQAYLDKRDQRHDARVNLVEIDLLLGGAPLPMKQRIVPGGYYAIVARGARLPVAELYRWSILVALPRIPIPLRPPDADVVIDLAALVNRIYTLGRYDRILRHALPLPEGLCISPEDRRWAEDLIVCGRK